MTKQKESDKIVLDVSPISSMGSSFTLALIAMILVMGFIGYFHVSYGTDILTCLIAAYFSGLPIGLFLMLVWSKKKHNTYSLSRMTIAKLFLWPITILMPLPIHQPNRTQKIDWISRLKAADKEEKDTLESPSDSGDSPDDKPSTPPLVIHSSDDDDSEDIEPVKPRRSARLKNKTD